MSDPVRTFIHSDSGLELLTTRFGDLFYTQGELSPYIRVAHMAEGIVLSLLATAVAAFTVRAAVEAVKPGVLAGVALGIGLACAGHQIRQTWLLDKRVTDQYRPYTTPFTTLYLDAFSVLKGRWQIVQATGIALVALAAIGATVRLAPIYPFATALFAAIAMSTVATYLAVDWVIGRSFRQI